MQLDADVIKIIIEGGTLSALLMFGIMGYRLALTAIDKVSTFVNNHLEHNTEAVKEGTEIMRQMKTEIVRMSDKLNSNNIASKANSEGWELRD